MRLAELKVEGFRSLRDVTIPLEAVTAFIGPNGSGKSSALAGLRLFFRPDEAISEEDYWRGQDGACANRVALSVTFTALSEAEAAVFCDYMTTCGDLTVTREFTGPGRGKYVCRRRGVADFMDVRRLAKGHRDAFNILAATGRFAGLERTTSKEEALQLMRRWETEHPGDCVEILEEVPSAPDDLRCSVCPVFIGALETPESQVETRTGGAMEELLRARTDVTTLAAELQKVVEEAGARTTQVFDEHGQVFREASSAIEATLSRFAPGFSLSFAWDAPRPFLQVLPRVLVSVLGVDGLPTDLAHQGHGIQRSLMLAVLMAQAETGTGDSHRGILVAIEEPEAFQHPLKSRALSATFLKLADRDYQFVFSTHSPELVSPGSVSGLRIFVHEAAGDGSGYLTTVRAFSVSHLAEALQAALRREGFTEASTVARLQANLDSRVLEGLFANLVVLVEGVEDEALLRGAARAANWDLDESGVSVIQCHGKTGIPLLVAFFREAGVSVFPVFDLDRQLATEQWKSSVWVEDAVRRLLGMPAEEELAATTLASEFACWREDIGKTVRQEIGEIYDSQELAVCAALGYDLTQGRKVGAVISAVLDACYAAGCRSPSLDALVDLLRNRVAGRR